jgi:hypothetical protein
MRSLVASHLLGNALLLWFGYYWLGLGEARASTLLWSLLVAVVLLGAACWLHGATLAYFSVAKRRLGWAFRITLPRLGLLVLAALGTLVVYALLARWAEYSSHPAFRVASLLTLTFRKPVKPSGVQTVFDIALWLVRWMIAPALALPVFAAIVSRRRRRSAWLFWLETPALLVCALWLPFTLLGWKPHMSGFTMEMVSFILRLLAAYLLFVAAWLALLFLTSGGSPRETQSKTVASP